MSKLCPRSWASFNMSSVRLFPDTSSTLQFGRRQDFVDGIPTLRSGHGTIEFRNMREGWRMFSSSAKMTLKGGGIESEVFIASLDSFRVAGPLNDV